MIEEEILQTVAGATNLGKVLHQLDMKQTELEAIMLRRKVVHMAFEPWSNAAKRALGKGVSYPLEGLTSAQVIYAVRNCVTIGDACKLLNETREGSKAKYEHIGYALFQEGFSTWKNFKETYKAPVKIDVTPKELDLLDKSTAAELGFGGIEAWCKDYLKEFDVPVMPGDLSKTAKKLGYTGWIEFKKLHKTGTTPQPKEDSVIRSRRDYKEEVFTWPVDPSAYDNKKEEVFDVLESLKSLKSEPTRLDKHSTYLEEHHASIKELQADNKALRLALSNLQEQLNSMPAKVSTLPPYKY